MKAMTREEGAWITVGLPPDTTDFDSMVRFMSQKDGTETVIIDEIKGKYYCGTNELVESYRRQSRDAYIFTPLAMELFNSITDQDFEF
jgi:hypothetical protein